MEMRQGAPEGTGSDGQPHCAAHSHFTSACSTCRQALANTQPYPMRAPKPVTRSYGFTDDLTAAKLRALTPPNSGSFYNDNEEFSLALGIVRFILRLIWPFSRII